MHRAQMVRGRDQIGDVGGELRVGELALARAEPGEIEAQHRDAARRQPFGDALGRQHVLAAGEAVREQRVTRPAGRPGDRAARRASRRAHWESRSVRTACALLLLPWLVRLCGRRRSAWSAGAGSSPAPHVPHEPCDIAGSRADHVGIIVGPDALAGGRLDRGPVGVLAQRAEIRILARADDDGRGEQVLRRRPRRRAPRGC